MSTRDNEPEIWLEDEEFGVPEEPIRKAKPDLGEDWEVDVRLDTEDVQLADPDLWESARGEPDWVIKKGYIEDEIGVIKSGKEAEVSLVRRTAGARSCLLAVKRYRPRSQRAFRREESYRAGQSFGDRRVDRAVGKRSRFGRAVLEYAWAYREFPLMRTAFEAGARVPYPVEALDDGLVMQYIGDEVRAAPKLSEVRLGPGEALDAFDDVVGNMRRLLDAYLVHGDLSAFNILWWEGRVWLIDFPQAADIAHSPRAVEFLRRDVANVCAYFRRCGLEPDEYDLFEDLMSDAPFAWTAGAGF